MRWTYGIKNKLTASIVLLTLCVLVLLSNYLDRIHSENIKYSISTLYEDRLVVEEYILKMTRDVYQIREIILEDKHLNLENDVAAALTADFKTTYTYYNKTRLTETERATATELMAIFKTFEGEVENDSADLLNYTHQILDTLHKLSEIQLEESLLIMKDVEAQYASIKMSSQFTFGIVIVILIVLQILVFSGKSIIPTFKPRDPSLN